MNINQMTPQTDQPKSGNGCLTVFLWGISLCVASWQLTCVAEFWPRCSMFLTILLGGIIGGNLGLKAGSALGHFVVPRSIFTDEGVPGLIRIKLFWLYGPALMGLFVGWALTIHLLLMLFWGMPITALGRVNIVSVRVEKQPTLAERWENGKRNVAFLDKIEKADNRTRNNYLLMCAIDAGSVVTVRKLVEEDVDVNTPRTVLHKDGLPYTDCEDLPPLWVAITATLCDEEIVTLLILHGADVNVRWEKMKGPTPLLYCLRNNRLGLVNMLVRAGADLNVVDVDGKTPLHHAVNKKMAETVELMLDRGANLSVKDRYGHTPMDYAEGQERKVITRWLRWMKIKQEQERK